VPSAIDSGTIAAKQIPASSSVLPRRSNSSSDTGWRKTIDWPKSPRAAFHMYSK
jgi:hypothetical protein